STYRRLEHPLPTRAFPELVLGCTEQVAHERDCESRCGIAANEEASHCLAIRGQIREPCNFLPAAPRPAAKWRYRRLAPGSHEAGSHVVRDRATEQGGQRHAEIRASHAIG